jgi:hypothetical protein
MCPGLDIASQGDTIEQAGANLIQAVELFFESADPSEIQDRLQGEVYVTPIGVATNVVLELNDTAITRPMLISRTFEIPRPKQSRAAHSNPIPSSTVPCANCGGPRHARHQHDS